MYRQILRSCDIVLSTALHDFQGLAVLEGVASGCVPVVPDRLAYPELLPRRYRYESHIGDGEREAQVLADRLRSLRPPLQAPVVTGLNWETLAPKYISIIDAFAGGT